MEQYRMYIFKNDKRPIKCVDLKAENVIELVKSFIDNDKIIIEKLKTSKKF